MLLLLILGDFLHRQPCYLWTKTVLFLPSQSGYLLFLFLVLLHSLRTFGMTLNTSGEGGYACFVIGRKASTFSPLSDVSCRVFVHVLYQFEEIPPLFLTWWVFKIINRYWILSIVLVLCVLIWSYDISSCYDCINWFFKCWASLPYWNTFQLVMVYKSFYVCGCVQSLSHVRLFVTPWTVDHLAPLSMGFLYIVGFNLLTFCTGFVHLCS